jgi:hypothetical protein
MSVRIANAEERALQRDGIVDAQRARLIFGDRSLELVVRHGQNP